MKSQGQQKSHDNSYNAFIYVQFYKSTRDLCFALVNISHSRWLAQPLLMHLKHCSVIISCHKVHKIKSKHNDSKSSSLPLNRHITRLPPSTPSYINHNFITQLLTSGIKCLITCEVKNSQMFVRAIPHNAEMQEGEDPLVWGWVCLVSNINISTNGKQE